MTVAASRQTRESVKTSIPIADALRIRRAAAAERMTVSAFVARAAAIDAERVLASAARSPVAAVG